MKTSELQKILSEYSLYEKVDDDYIVRVASVDQSGNITEFRWEAYSSGQYLFAFTSDESIRMKTRNTQRGNHACIELVDQYDRIYDFCVQNIGCPR